MEQSDTAWPQYIIYIFIMVFVFLTSTVFGQIEAKHFNAGWNDANSVAWFMDLKDCKTLGLTDIAKNPEEATKHKISLRELLNNEISTRKKQSYLDKKTKKK